MNITKTDDRKARVAISPILLEKLISSGMIHGDDCKCLNNDAKQIMWQSLLKRSLSIKTG